MRQAETRCSRPTGTLTQKTTLRVVEPAWIGRIDQHEIPKENSRDVGQAEGRAGMTTVGLLYGIHGKKPDMHCRGARHISGTQRANMQIAK